MRMPHRHDGDARGHIEPTLPVDVEQLAALAAREDHRRRLVVRVEAFLREGEELGSLGHGRPTLAPQGYVTLFSRIARAISANPSPRSDGEIHRGGTLMRLAKGRTF